ncbi:MAG: MotA/TolQ/ExbB proton channel family protein [Pseudomonadota bacterium]
MLSAIGAAVAGGAVSEVASDFSLVSLLLEAHIVVRLVLLSLVIASLWSWAVIIEKWFSLGSLRKSSQRFEDAFWSGRSDGLEGRPGQGGGDPAARVFAAASREWNDARRVASDAEIGPLVDRAERAMRATVDREVGRASRGTGVLATVGSASPFIGLFGTVWGIMYAFINISANNDTSLANVAGPIAEALFATGLGLVAAIPATIFYNKFTGDIARFADQLDTFSQDILVRLSRRAADGSGG